jgi:hypothetical protein
LQALRSFPTGAGVLGDDDIIRLGAELFRTLFLVQSDIGTDDELRFLEFLQTTFYRVCIAVDEKNAERRGFALCALRSETSLIRLDIVLSQAGHQNTPREPPKPSIKTTCMSR